MLGLEISKRVKELQERLCHQIITPINKMCEMLLFELILLFVDIVY